MNNYTQLKEVGKGTCGTVYKEQNKETGEVVAIKKFHKEIQGQVIPLYIYREVQLLKQLKHPNIVSLKNTHLDENRVCLVFEYLPMDLRQYLDSLQPEDYINSSTLKSYLYQITQAILYCHTKEILHRDLKPENLLVDNKGIIKISDFGLGRSISGNKRALTPEVVTLWYRAPELLLGFSYSYPLDIWSIACIYSEMASKRALFRGRSKDDQLTCIFTILDVPTEKTWPGITKLLGHQVNLTLIGQNKLASNTKIIDINGFDLLEKMLICNPFDRITASQILNHKYFQD